MYNTYMNDQILNNNLQGATMNKTYLSYLINLAIEMMKKDNADVSGKGVCEQYFKKALAWDSKKLGSFLEDSGKMKELSGVLLKPVYHGINAN